MLNFRKISRKTSVLIAVALLSSGATYLVCQSHFSNEIDELNDKIHLLEESERKAIVTQRISEQMEDIAYQSKSIADTALQRAVFERGKAEEQTRRAEAERHNALIAKGKADVAEQQAREQAQKAEHERMVAQQAQLVAETEKAKADTLRYISLGRSLAQTAITQYNAGEYTLADLLAYSGYTYTMEYGGSPYQQDVFTALLYNSETARKQIASFTGDVRAVSCLNRSFFNTPDACVLAATDYGEVGLLTPHYSLQGDITDISVDKLFSNNRFIFRDMCVKDTMAYILDVDGGITELHISKEGRSNTRRYSIASATHPAERWTHLLAKKNGQLIAVGEHQIAWYDPKTHSVFREKYIGESITEAGIGDGKLLIFTDKKKYYVFKEGVQAEWPFDIAKQCTITAYYYLKASHLHVVGTSIGIIYLCDDSGNLKYTLTGHTGPVTHIESADWCLVTSSYDKTVRLWDLNNIGELVVPLDIKCTSWPLTFAIDKNKDAIRIGCADGSIESIRYSTSTNANYIKNNLQREFSPEEWRYYIGNDVPYRTFK